MDHRDAPAPVAPFALSFAALARRQNPLIASDEQRKWSPERRGSGVSGHARRFEARVRATPLPRVESAVLQVLQARGRRSAAHHAGQMAEEERQRVARRRAAGKRWARDRGWTEGGGAGGRNAPRCGQHGRGTKAARSRQTLRWAAQQLFPQRRVGWPGGPRRTSQHCRLVEPGAREHAAKPLRGCGGRRVSRALQPLTERRGRIVNTSSARCSRTRASVFARVTRVGDAGAM